MLFLQSHKPPFFDSDAEIFGILMAILAFVFYTSNQSKSPFWSKFYKIVPALLMAYLLPAILTSFNLISTEWHVIGEDGTKTLKKSNLYFVATRFLLPAALFLMTLSIDFKGLVRLGWKPLVMFLTGTLGIIIGGPLAIGIFSILFPQTVETTGDLALWRGFSTLAGSWIGGGANQTAMLELFKYDQQKYGAMLLVDIVVANIWMAFLLFGIERRKKINKWLKADNRSVNELINRMEDFGQKVKRDSNLSDFLIILGLAFFGTSMAHFLGQTLSSFFGSIKYLQNSTLSSSFFWLVVLSTSFGLMLSFTKARNLEGVGASKFGSVFIWILVSIIGMKMDIKQIFEEPQLIAMGILWMAIHVILLIIVARIIRAPYFFLAVGSKANVGGAASAPVVAAAFHPSLATVGVLLAVLGYALGTYGALICTYLMQWISK
ncbi:MAG: hypothetical protein CNE98_03295 [Bacteroidetes bacterium MED-G17]|nr:MAG: hypothetical protein CNE98_03295 [Bacteroidetes bacterium MED-G17]|tara:strand:+ start:7041 stop:8342 length:1302 start_codon:yes stop_codon:yes gene_type:complete